VFVTVWQTQEKWCVWSCRSIS